MRVAIQLLTRLVAAQARHQEEGIGYADRCVSARVHDFINLDPPVFTGADPNEDPQAYAQGLEERKQKQRMDREHNRAHNKRVRSLGPSGPGQNCRASGSQYRGESSQMRSPLPRCAKCGKQYAGQCRMGLGVCYTCGYLGHIIRDYPTRGEASITQPAGSVAGSSSSASSQILRVAGSGRPRNCEESLHLRSEDWAGSDRQSFCRIAEDQVRNYGHTFAIVKAAEITEQTVAD
ncbi:PREDICTED: uncharacterized protein LOC109214107 [Nicotiana attenuata]|uniref:uncharacterized protein LOC109214107 n=1 Tax=Nicotiana attenuata TaxID=49451 RepID=UPI0009050703|nr:PREDICTED: uncharacterized protein LOC109214107 [Nicotiana attenuata]